MLKDFSEQRPAVGQLIVMVAVNTAHKPFESPVDLLKASITRWTHEDEENARVDSPWMGMTKRPNRLYWADATDALRAACAQKSEFIEEQAKRSRECLKESEARYGL